MCPFCGNDISGAVTVHGLTVCPTCQRTLVIVDGAHEVRLATSADADGLSADQRQQVKMAGRATRTARRERSPQVGVTLTLRDR